MIHEHITRHKIIPSSHKTRARKATLTKQSTSHLHDTLIVIIKYQVFDSRGDK